MESIATKAQAERALDEFSTLMEELSRLIGEETALVHAGHVRRATVIAARKQELAAQLFGASERLRAHAPFVVRFAPERCSALKSAQQSFRSVLQKNLTVLATAHAVSEAIVRRLSGELARKASPQVYGASGRALTPDPRHSRPLALSRTL